MFFLSLRLYKRNFSRLLAVYLLAEAVYVPVGALLQYLIPIYLPSPGATGNGFDILTRFEDGLSIIPQTLISVIILSPITSISSGLGVSLTAESIEKGQSALKTSYRRTIGNIRQIWYLTLITGFVNALSGPLFILPLVFFILFFMALPAVVVENGRALGGIVRGRRLLSNRWGEIFLLLLMVGAIVAVPVLVVDYAVNLLSPFGLIVVGIEGAFIGPLYDVASTVAFYSNSARLSNQEEGMVEPETNMNSKLWICRNCKTSLVSRSMPSAGALGGCGRAQRGFFSQPKHVWEESTSPPSRIEPS